MYDHPSAGSFTSFLLGELSQGEVKSIVAHLARGCPSCEQQIEALSRELFGEGSKGPAAGTSGDPEYDAAIDRAFAAAVAVATAERDIRPLHRELLSRAGKLTFAAPPTPVREAPLCEELIARSRACRHDDPQRMIHFARRARFAAANLDPARYGEATVLAMQARTAAELANAYRVADDLEHAESSMREAVERSAGCDDPQLLAHLMDLLASLDGNHRRFDAAIELLEAVHQIYRTLGDDHRAGRALISRGLYTSYANDPRQALVLLTEGFEHVDAAREPELALAAVHNILDCLVELGRGGEAAPLLERFRPLYQRYGGRLDRLRLRWVEGKVAAATEEQAVAERCFIEVRLGFEEAGLASPCALVSLDLAAVWLRQGRFSEARDLVEEVLATFQALRIAPEALASLFLLREAFTHQSTALGVLRSIAECLKRIGPAPGMRLDPDAD